MDQASPKGELPQIEGQEGNKLLHTVSFYRKQKANVNVTPLPKVVRSGAMPSTIEEEIEVELLVNGPWINIQAFSRSQSNRESIQQEIRKLQIEAEEQRQRMEQASKALNFCVTQDEFEGSSERVRKSKDVTCSLFDHFQNDAFRSRENGCCLRRLICIQQQRRRSGDCRRRARSESRHRRGRSKRRPRVARFPSRDSLSR